MRSESIPVYIDAIICIHFDQITLPRCQSESPALCQVVILKGPRRE